jgi:hypothetical protein
MGLMTPCREWQGAKNQYGYGVKRDKERKKNVLVHRWVVAQIDGWEAVDGLCVLHHCDNPPCYRYDHLFIGTKADNMADKTNKGRSNSPKGERCHTAKLTETDVRAIRSTPRSYGSTAELARQYGVAHSTIKNIRARKAWTHVN